MAKAMRVAGDKKGKGGKAMAMATRVAGERTATVMKRAMVTAMREAGKEERNGKSDTSNGNGKEDGKCKHR